MKTVTDEEYHLTFGLHSGIPLCCAIAFSESSKGGPCPRCLEKGVTKKDIFSRMHWCNENDAPCQIYLDLVDLRTIEHYKHHRLQRSVNLVKGVLDDFTWGCSSTRPLGGEIRDLLREDGFRMVHICWPEFSTYWYIWQQYGGKKGKCGICNTKFSLALPTTGKVR